MLTHLLLAILTVVSTIAAPQPDDLFDNVASTLAARYYDRDFARDALPQLIDEYQERVEQTTDRTEEREIVFEFLSHIPASHLALLSEGAHEHLMGELFGNPTPTLGFELTEQDGAYFVRGVYAGGPADESGLLTGDVVTSIDGVMTPDSPRLEWRTDDAALPDLPRHRVLANDGESIELEIERRPGERHVVRVAAQKYPAIRATRAGARLIERDGASIAYAHFWYIHNDTLNDLLVDLAHGPFADADALVLDLRGRGGSGSMVDRLMALFVHRVWDRPLVLLIDSESRSAKEVLSWELQRRGIGRFVGQRTAGAVLPATFANVGEGMVLMFPAFPYEPYTSALEGKGVQPHVEAPEPGPYAAGEDPILNAGLDEAARLVRAIIN